MAALDEFWNDFILLPEGQRFLLTDIERLNRPTKPNSHEQLSKDFAEVISTLTQQTDDEVDLSTDDEPIEQLLFGSQQKNVYVYEEEIASALSTALNEALSKYTGDQTSNNNNNEESEPATLPASDQIFQDILHGWFDEIEIDEEISELEAEISSIEEELARVLEKKRQLQNSNSGNLSPTRSNHFPQSPTMSSPINSNVPSSPIIMHSPSPLLEAITGSPKKDTNSTVVEIIVSPDFYDSDCPLPNSNRVSDEDDSPIKTKKRSLKRTSTSKSKRKKKEKTIDHEESTPPDSHVIFLPPKKYIKKSGTKQDHVFKKNEVLKLSITDDDCEEDVDIGDVSDYVPN